MNLPSKELLSAVLNDTVHEVQLLNNNAVFGNVQLWISSDKHDTTVNIYELAHKCKEWARSNGYLLYSVPDLCIVKTLNLEYCVDFGLSTEVESIFRACQWILDNKETK